MVAAVLGLICLAASLTYSKTLDLPRGPVTRLASPDGAFILYQRASGSGPRLWIEDTRTHRRTKLLDIGGTLSAAWSPDGSAFYVNDRWASDRERAYIYEAATLKRLDIADRILSADPNIRRYATGHAYFEIGRWVGTQHVAVRFFGHTDVPPVSIFEFTYAVNRAGVVEKVGRRASIR